MKNKPHIQLNLSKTERKNLRSHKMKISDIPDYAVDELEILLEATPERAREIQVMTDFQRIPSIGIKFAEDLISLGFFSVSDLQGKKGAKLMDEFERKRGVQIDGCVEDQFRLAVHFADTNDYSKKWWDFTSERKRYRQENGYPPDRPTRVWHEV